jgi:hypothetical protein
MTPGEAAYSAFLKALGQRAKDYCSWSDMGPLPKSAWEAAALAGAAQLSRNEQETSLGDTP